VRSLIRNFGKLTLFGVILCTTDALAQSQSVTKETTTTTTTTTSGTVSEFGPNLIVVRTTTSSEPIRYSTTKTTTVVDEMGRPVAIESVKSGAPVTVYHDQGRATKVIVTDDEVEIDD
jgi:hypothetical protein